MIEILKFGAEWCGPCRAMEPTIKQLMEKYNVENSGVVVRDINVDNESQLASKHAIRSIPTVIFVQDGIEVEKFVGLKSADDIEQVIKKMQENQVEL